MKDAKGHGSNPRGSHSSGVVKVSKNSFKPVRTAAGQVDHRIGQVWEKVSAHHNRTVAERIAQLQRIDNKNSIIRVK